jgi:acyl phosphate:glycerol-3-phosphate acyltransferase
MHYNFAVLLCLLLCAYLLGSIPFGLILVKRFKSEDIREIGSGNIGATNVRRAAGWGLAVITLACDFLKGAVPVYVAGLLVSAGMPCKEIWVSLAALSAFCGHLFPVYLKFKTGGKGVATAAGCFAVLSWPALAISLLVFTAAVILSKRVSMGSLSAAAVLPAGVMWAQRSLVLTGCALIISALVLYRHRDNIRRLIAGDEPPLWGK